MINYLPFAKHIKVIATKFNLISIFLNRINAQNTVFRGNNVLNSTDP